ncbi:MAG: hypothetical protein OEQ53_15930 [Saprospiraceae bacterium]|nr:hypothetical protein [Saprospiraceae bacterium]
MKKPTAEALAPTWILTDDQFNRFKENGFLLFRDQVRVSFSHSHMQDEIHKMLRIAKGIVQPHPDDLKESIDGQRSIVGMDLNDRIVAHQRFKLWPTLKLAELRTAFVRPECRGIGLNTFMKKVMLNLIHLQHPDWDGLGYCQPLSMSKNIFAKLGFQEVSLDFVKEQWSTLEKDCPKSDCYLKNDYACGCQVVHLQF